MSSSLADESFNILLGRILTSAEALVKNHRQYAHAVDDTPLEHSLCEHLLSAVFEAHEELFALLWHSGIIDPSTSRPFPRANASNLLHVGGSGQNFPEKLGV